MFVLVTQYLFIVFAILFFTYLFLYSFFNIDHNNILFLVSFGFYGNKPCFKPRGENFTSRNTAKTAKTQTRRTENFVAVYKPRQKQSDAKTNNNYVSSQIIAPNQPNQMLP